MPVTYASMRATCAFFMETHYHTGPSFSVRSKSFAIRGHGAKQKKKRLYELSRNAMANIDVQGSWRYAARH